MQELFATIEGSNVSTWLRESNTIWAYPLVLTLHTVGLALLVGANTTLDLRLLGFGRYKTFFSSKAADRDLQARADRVLELCRLDEVTEKPAATLSYGEEKMLGVAMAMMCEPKLLLLDEPASGLGQQEIANLGLVLRDLREHGTTLCIIDHKVAFLAEFAHRLIALQNGNKIAEGSPQEVLADQSVITAYLGRQHVGA